MAEEVVANLLGGFVFAVGFGLLQMAFWFAVMLGMAAVVVAITWPISAWWRWRQARNAERAHEQG